MSGKIAVGKQARVVKLAVRYVASRKVAQRWFDSDGVRMMYRDEGSGSVVVLLHGFAVTADLNWRLPGVIESLASKHRVISVDMRGHGKSGKPLDASAYGIEMARDVVRLLDHLEIERAHVAGYSLGGFVTLKLATLAPERLASVAVLGAGWESPDNTAFLEALPRLADALEAGRGVGPLMGHLGSDRPQPGWSHRLWVKLMTRYFNDQRALVGVVRGAVDLVVTEQELRKIPVPVCSIVGSRDPIRGRAEAMVGLVPRLSSTLVEGADHISAPMRPELHTALAGFLQATSR